jgi:polyisoprenoid-binding protein YceI
MNTRFLRSVIALGAGATVLSGVTLGHAHENKHALQTKSLKPADITGTWVVDKDHTDIAFTATHLGVSKTHGHFSDFDGKVIVDGAKQENSSVTFTIKVDSLDTGNKQRDTHLKSKDFFDAETYPDITFKSTKVQKKGKEYAVTGDLTIHGITKPVTLTFEPHGPQAFFDKKLHAGLETHTQINRQDFNLKWNALIEGTQVVGNIIDIDISFEAIKQ